MTCSMNHANLTTKFCSVCGAPAIQQQQQYQQPPQQYMPPQQQYQPQYQQPVYGQPQINPYDPAITEGYPYPLASVGMRIGAWAIDLGFALVTCGIGWFVWLLVVMNEGQTPGKQLLKMRTYGTDLKRQATWGHMAVRQILIPLAISMIRVPVIIMSFDSYYYSPYGFNGGLDALLTLAIWGFWLADAIIMFTHFKRQRIIDKWAKTIILDESKGRYYA